jgi:hypothetical protein
LYKNLLYKSEFGQTTVKSGFRLLQVSTNFRSLNYFMSFKQLKKQLINATVSGLNRPTTCATRAKTARSGGTAACHARPTHKSAGPWPGGPVQLRRRPAMHGNGARTVRSRRGHRAQQRRGGAGRRQGAADEHRWGLGVALGQAKWRRGSP